MTVSAEAPPTNDARTWPRLRRTKVGILVMLNCFGRRATALTSTVQKRTEGRWAASLAILTQTYLHLRHQRAVKSTASRVSDWQRASNCSGVLMSRTWPGGASPQGFAVAGFATEVESLRAGSGVTAWTWAWAWAWAWAVGVTSREWFKGSGWRGVTGGRGAKEDVDRDEDEINEAGATCRRDGGVTRGGHGVRKQRLSAMLKEGRDETFVD